MKGARKWSSPHATTLLLCCSSAPRTVRPPHPLSSLLGAACGPRIRHRWDGLQSLLGPLMFSCGGTGAARKKGVGVRRAQAAAGGQSRAEHSALGPAPCKRRGGEKWGATRTTVSVILPVSALPRYAHRHDGSAPSGSSTCRDEREPQHPHRERP